MRNFRNYGTAVKTELSFGLTLRKNKKNKKKKDNTLLISKYLPVEMFIIYTVM